MSDNDPPMEPSSIGKILIWTGSLILLVGLVLAFGPRIPLLGKLPGDIHVERDGFSFHFPLATCLLLSILISLAFWIAGRFR